MPEWIMYVLPPVIGAVIGAVTNDVAIRMLFRPREQWRLGTISLPLTPGLIPKQRYEISQSIAETFVENVFDGDDVLDLILNAENRPLLENKVSGVIDKLGGMLKINRLMLSMVKEFAGNYILKEITEFVEESGLDTEKIKQMIQQKIDDMDLATLEELVLGFSKEQFRYITVFGAFLGFLIGCIQVLLFVIPPMSG